MTIVYSSFFDLPNSIWFSIMSKMFSYEFVDAAFWWDKDSFRKLRPFDVSGITAIYSNLALSSVYKHRRNTFQYIQWYKDNNSLLLCLLHIHSSFYLVWHSYCCEILVLCEAFELKNVRYNKSVWSFFHHINLNFGSVWKIVIFTIPGIIDTQL